MAERASSVSGRTAAVFAGLVLLTAAMTAGIVALASHTERASSEPLGGRDANGAIRPTVQVDLNEFSVAVSQFATASAGRVTFVVKNRGSIDHEMIVLKTNQPVDKIPIVDGGDPPAPVKSGADKVDEAGNVGETGDPDLKPGGTRTFTIKHLAPGHYALICNIATHYGLGMRAAFTVTNS